MNKSKIPCNFQKDNPIEKYTDVRPSIIHGFGLFAKRFIPKGTIWWNARPHDILIISKKQFLIFDSSQKTKQKKEFMHFLLTYSYYERDTDSLIFCLDNSRFVNHSFNANSGAIGDNNGFCSISLRDIQQGEEITEDYSKYDLCSWLKKYKEYFDPSCW